ncbi:hypothetical protein [Aquabacter spiritensis]|nr:hypothetical protein [Aquabacter spiritensis]
MSEFREFGMLRVGASAADPEALARAVRKHKTGDAMAQAALTVALMMAICAVTFVLSVDGAAAFTLGGENSSVASHLLFGASLAATGAVAVGILLWTNVRTRAVPVRVRRSRRD